ncbi:unnamed protein product [Nesidiocoris tenuis]|uniref:Uncharacterized protein n=1 Tax=Nesidiocoris tenuis TaxID=355587 RepID=A0A6H5FYG6_9HEMI|nr:unnamed protein product [Nesidiocoris tenuis]
MPGPVFFLKMAPSVWEVGNTLLNNGPARTVNQGPSLVTATNDRNICQWRRAEKELNSEAVIISSESPHGLQLSNQKADIHHSRGKGWKTVPVCGHRARRGGKVLPLGEQATMKLAILGCLSHCYFCAEMGFIQPDLYHYVPGCIMNVETDLSLLLDCELNKTDIMKKVYDRWSPYWGEFEPNGTTANRIVVLINGLEAELNILDTGLRGSLCSQLEGEDHSKVCQGYTKMSNIRKIKPTPIKKNPGQRSSGRILTILAPLHLSIVIVLIIIIDKNYCT